VSRSLAAVLRAFDDGKHRAEFYRMWRIGVSAGLTHGTVLEKVGHLTGPTKEIHAHLAAGFRAGQDVSRLVRERPGLFEPFEAALLTMADESGQLEGVLGDLAAFFERQHRMMLVVKKHLAYPLFVSLVAIWIAPLPLLFMAQSRAYVAAVVVGMIGWFAFGGAVLANRARSYQRKPMYVRARFARTLALTIGAGLPLPRAIRFAAAASGEPALVAHVGRFDERRLASQSLVETLAGAPTLTPDFQGALRVAEETGDFRTTLGRLAESYEDGFR
jgi:type IV pilus assembly protein PilC